MIHLIKKFPRSPKEVVEGFRRVAPATAYEVMGKRGAMDTTIKPVYLGRGWPQSYSGVRSLVEAHPETPAQPP